MTPGPQCVDVNGWAQSLAPEKLDEIFQKTSASQVAVHKTKPDWQTATGYLWQHSCPWYGFFRMSLLVFHMEGAAIDWTLKSWNSKAHDDGFPIVLQAVLTLTQLGCAFLGQKRRCSHVNYTFYKSCNVQSLSCLDGKRWLDARQLFWLRKRVPCFALRAAWWSWPVCAAISSSTIFYPFAVLFAHFGPMQGHTYCQNGAITLI